MEVTWSKPPSNAINGKLLGYRVYYFSIKNPEKVFNRTVTDPNERNVTLRGLGKYTTYMIRVVAFTRKGEGVASPAKGGTTLEDSKFYITLHYIVLHYAQYCKKTLAYNAARKAHFSLFVGLQPTIFNCKSSWAQRRLRRLTVSKRSISRKSSNFLWVDV